VKPDLARVRAMVAEHTNATVHVETRDRGTGTVNPTTLELDPDVTPAWDGRVLISTGLRPALDDTAGLVSAEQRATVRFPIGPVFAIGQWVIVTAHDSDPDLVANEYQIEALDHRTYRSSQMLTCCEQLPKVAP
jgi:hypothetical protein